MSSFPVRGAGDTIFAKDGQNGISPCNFAPEDRSARRAESGNSHVRSSKRADGQSRWLFGASAARRFPQCASIGRQSDLTSLSDAPTRSRNATNSGGLRTFSAASDARVAEKQARGAVSNGLISDSSVSDIEGPHPLGRRSGRALPPR